MPKTMLRVKLLDDSGDIRGSSFSPGAACTAFLDQLEDLHITTLLPGHTRGNHYHRLRREVLLVLFKDRWELNWDQGESTPASCREFHGAGVAVVEVEPESSHAVTNTGVEPLWIVGLSSAAYVPGTPDAFERIVRPKTHVLRPSPSP
jgi:hypothetical protein